MFWFKCKVSDNRYKKQANLRYLSYQDVLHAIKFTKQTANNL